MDSLVNFDHIWSTVWLILNQNGLLSLLDTSVTPHKQYGDMLGFSSVVF